MHVSPSRCFLGALGAALVLWAQAALATPPHCTQPCQSACDRDCPAECKDTCPADCKAQCPASCPADCCPAEHRSPCCPPCPLFDECCEDADGEDCCDEGGWDFFWFTKKRDFARGKKCEQLDSKACDAAKGCECQCNCDKCGCNKKHAAAGYQQGKMVCFPADKLARCPIGKFVHGGHGMPGYPVGKMMGCPPDHLAVWPHPIAESCFGPPPPPAPWAGHQPPWMFEKMAALMAENAALTARWKVEKEYDQKVKELEHQLQEARHEVTRLKGERTAGGDTAHVLGELVKTQAETAALKDELLVELLGGLIELQLELPEGAPDWDKVEAKLDKLEQAVKQSHAENAALKAQLAELKKQTRRVLRSQLEQENRATRATWHDDSWHDGSEHK